MSHLGFGLPRHDFRATADHWEFLGPWSLVIVHSTLIARRVVESRLLTLLCLLAISGALATSNALGQGTAFTYQGRLSASGTPGNGNFDFTFAAWSAVSGGVIKAGPVTNSSVLVSNGLFTVTLDLGSAVFNGQAIWLEISVRPFGGGTFTTLSPRQPCTPTPYAITAATVTGSVSASQITGVLAAGNIGAGTVSAADLAPNAAVANLNAAGQSGVAASGLVLSTTENNTSLINAGYVKIYGSFGTPDTWQAYTNPPATPPPSARNSHTAIWTGTEMIAWGGYGGGSYLNNGGRYNPAVNGWTTLPVTTTTPAGRLSHTAVWTGGGMIVWGGVGGTNQFNDGGLYDPVLNGWNYIPGTLPNTPSPRLHHSAVWTGNAMIIWGGGSATALNDGALYNPGLNNWTNLPNSLPNTPVARAYHTAVWTGTEMIVWGGIGGTNQFNDGGRYIPSTGQWVAISNSLTNSPAARQFHSSVWTGTEMIVWGGASAAGDLNDGGRFNPGSSSWILIPNSLAGTPVARESHTAVWSGSEMIVWGGFSGTAGALLNDGGRFNPASNQWISVSNTLANAPGSRYEHSAVWTGTEMIIWGGSTGSSELNDGGRFNPALGSWIYLPNAISAAPSPRAGHTSIWNGSEMIVWGGANGSSYLNDGGRFNPALNNWIYLAGNVAGSPAGRYQHTAIWSGSEMMIWGGANSSGFLNDGGRYNPASGAWTPIMGTLPNAPATRANHTAIWSGSEMIAWGGIAAAGNLNDGGRFNPLTGGWIAIAPSLPNTPLPRANHTAVWTGAEMVVWGGNTPTNCYADGGRYNPAQNSWISIANSLTGTPGARAAHTAVWTGTTMIVWGGSGCGIGGSLNDGGIFSPASGAWSYLPNSLPGTPSARSGQTAVWSGSEMIIWGGINSSYFADGGRYNPALNVWNPILASLTNAPTSRAGHSALWTGSQMLTWGGHNGVYFNDTFGYTPGRNLYLYQRP